MKTTKRFKVSGLIDVHIDGDIYIEDPKTERFLYAGSLIDKDIDVNGFVCGLNGKYVKEFIKVLKKIVIK